MVALRVRAAVLNQVHRRLMSSSGVVISCHLLSIAEIDRNSSLPSACVIIDCMERILLNYIEVISETTVSYA